MAWNQRRFDSALDQKYAIKEREVDLLEQEQDQDYAVGMRNADANRITAQSGMRNSFAKERTSVTDRLKEMGERGIPNTTDLQRMGILGVGGMFGSSQAPSRMGGNGPAGTTYDQIQRDGNSFSAAKIWHPNNFMNGGLVTKKLKQPGYMHGGKIKPPMASRGLREGGYAYGGGIEPGVIGDVNNDTGADTIDAAVRPGEYLLNPETVAFVGKGDHTAGVEALDNLVTTATGEEPGPVPIDGNGEELPDGGEWPGTGYAKSGKVGKKGKNPYKRGTEKWLEWEEAKRRAKPQVVRPPITQAEEMAAIFDELTAYTGEEAKRTEKATRKAVADQYEANREARNSRPSSEWEARRTDADRGVGRSSKVWDSIKKSRFTPSGVGFGAARESFNKGRMAGAINKVGTVAGGVGSSGLKGLRYASNVLGKASGLATLPMAAVVGLRDAGLLGGDKISTEQMRKDMHMSYDLDDGIYERAGKDALVRGYHLTNKMGNILNPLDLLPDSLYNAEDGSGTIGPDAFFEMLPLVGGQKAEAEQRAHERNVQLMGQERADEARAYAANNPALTADQVQAQAEAEAQQAQQAQIDSQRAQVKAQQAPAPAPSPASQLYTPQGLRVSNASRDWMNKQGFANGGQPSSGNLIPFPMDPVPNQQWLEGQDEENQQGIPVPQFRGEKQRTMGQVVPGYQGDDSDSPAYYAGTYGGQNVIASKTVDPDTGKPVTNFTGSSLRSQPAAAPPQVDPALQSIYRQLNFGGGKDMEGGQEALKLYRANQLANQGAAQDAAKITGAQIESVKSMLNAAFVEKNEKGEYMPSGDDIAEFLRTGLTSEQMKMALNEAAYIPRLVQDFVDKSLINKRLNRARPEVDKSDISKFIPRGKFRDIGIGDNAFSGDTDVSFWADYLPSKLTPGTDQVFETKSGLTVPADRALRDAYKRLSLKQ